MKYWYSILTLFSLTACAAPHADLLLGARNFDGGSTWEQTDVQPAVGIQVDTAGRNGFGLETGFLVSSDTSYNDQYVNRKVEHTEATVREYYAGLRNNWMLSNKWQLTAGGGLAYGRLTQRVTLAYQGDSYEETAESLAPYVQLGLNYYVGNGYNVGLLARHDFWTEGYNVYEIGPSADSTSVMLTFGYSF